MTDSEKKALRKSKPYIGVKIIRACPMDEARFVNTIKNDVFEPGRPNRDGYFVIYPDGYKSWSPKNVFEKAYREIADGEYDLLQERD